MDEKCDESEVTVTGERFEYNVDDSVDAKIGESIVEDAGDGRGGSAEGSKLVDMCARLGTMFSLFRRASQILLVPG
jgi:hypothetical protein